tara:strand:+ start:502 stop:1050 length:549 start_codon:yes stop_codon:yes gene_type:complete
MRAIVKTIIDSALSEFEEEIVNAIKTIRDTFYFDFGDTDPSFTTKLNTDWSNFINGELHPTVEKSQKSGKTYYSNPDNNHSYTFNQQDIWNEIIENSNLNISSISQLTGFIYETPLKIVNGLISKQIQEEYEIYLDIANEELGNLENSRKILDGFYDSLEQKEDEYLKSSLTNLVKNIKTFL